MNKHQQEILNGLTLRPCLKLNDLPITKNCKIIKIQRLQIKFGMAIKVRLEIRRMVGKRWKGYFYPAIFAAMTDEKLKILKVKLAYLIVEQKIGRSHQVTLRLEQDDIMKYFLRAVNRP